VSVDTVTAEDIDRWREALDRAEWKFLVRNVEEGMLILRKLDDELFELWSRKVVQESR
jgi:hypothetical protein